MYDRSVFEAEPFPDSGQHIAIERAARVVLLLLAGGLRPELLRRHQIEDVDVTRGQVAIPGCGPASRDHHHSPAARTVLSQPSKEGDPIQQLEADFTRPGSDEDISIGADSR